VKRKFKKAWWERFLLNLQLERLESVEKDLETLEQRIQEKLKAYAAQLALLKEIPGVDWTLVAVIIAELGVDMSVFADVSQLTSWAGVCPAITNRQASARAAESPRVMCI
jgi:transposase